MLMKLSAFGDTINLDIPSKEGYNFNGWHIEVPSNIPANDLELQATWALVTYQTDANNITVNNLDKISAKYIDKNKNVNLILDIKPN